MVIQKTKEWNCSPLTLSKGDSASSIVKGIIGKTNTTEGLRWDMEWMDYLGRGRTGDPRMYFLRYDQLQVLEGITGKDRDAVFATKYCTGPKIEDFWPLGIFVTAEEIQHRNVLEIGCGMGLLGKQMGMLAAKYVGIDYSPLALSVARIVSPINCFYYHITDVDGIASHRNSIDTMVCRNFLIHNNYENVSWILQLANYLLKEGGIVSCDFFHPNGPMPQRGIFPAKSGLDPDNASCGFVFSDDEIEELSVQTGFTIETIQLRPTVQRKFVILVKCRDISVESSKQLDYEARFCHIMKMKEKAFGGLLRK